MSELFAEIDRVINRLDSDDPNFDDCIDVVALLERMRAEMAGPDGFPAWRAAAVHERQARATAESRLAAAEADAERYRGLRDGGYLDRFVDPVHPCDEPKRGDMIDEHVDTLIRCDAARGGE